MFIQAITVALLLTGWLAPRTGFAAEPPAHRLEITGDYRYVLRGGETAAEGKALACREALRLAVINSPLYREQTAGVVNAPLLHSLAHTLTTQYVQDQRIIEQSERGRTVSCRVQGYLPISESTQVFRTQLGGGTPPAEGTEQNLALRIMSVREDSPGVIAIQYQALVRLDWLGTHYQGGLRESAEIMVDFFDDRGFLIRTERHQARRTPSGDDVINPGTIAVLKVTKPAGAKTYRIWLVK